MRGTRVWLGQMKLLAKGTWNLNTYQAEAHIGITLGTGYQLLDSALSSQGISRKIVLELPGFLGLSAILSTTDLVATLPRGIWRNPSASQQVCKSYPAPLRYPASRQTILARTLPPRQRQPLDAWGLCGFVYGEFMRVKYDSSRRIYCLIRYQKYSNFKKSPLQLNLIRQRH